MTTRFLGTSDDVTTCDCCGRTGLKSTVALCIDDSDDVLYYGVVCAARALKTTAKVVRAETKAADDAARDARLRAEWERGRAEDAKWQAFLDAAAPGHLDWQGKPNRCRQIEALGGYKAARSAYEAA